MNQGLSREAIIRGILFGSEGSMPKKYQNPAMKTRIDVPRKYYYIRYFIRTIGEDGKPKRIRKNENLGFLDETSVKEARRRRAEILEVVNAGRILAQSQVKFRDLAQRFLDTRVPQLGVATQAKYRTQIRLHLVPAFGDLALYEIDRPRVEEFLTAKANAGLGWWTRIDLKGVLSGIFTTAKNWKLWDGDNPTEGVRIGRKKLVREKRLLTAEQLRMILAALDDRERFIVQLLFGLGLRISEALGLIWEDVDFDRGVLSIRRRWYRGDWSETKTENSEDDLQLGKALLDEFRQRYPGPHKRKCCVFVGDDGHAPPDDRDILRENFRPILKRLGLYYKGFGWHAFRRQNITWRQTIGGATPLEAQKAARHGSVDMTLLYTLRDSERERNQVDLMFEKLMETEPGKTQ